MKFRDCKETLAFTVGKSVNRSTFIHEALHHIQRRSRRNPPIKKQSKQAPFIEKWQPGRYEVKIHSVQL